jgi:hypothetical protein
MAGSKFLQEDPMKQYIDSIEEFMNQSKERFKFEIGSEVHHHLFKTNGIICRRMYMEEPGEKAIVYDIGIVGKETRVISEVDEYWVRPGYLKEE